MFREFAAAHRSPLPGAVTKRRMSLPSNGVLQGGRIPVLLRFSLFSVIALLAGCLGMPETVKPVSGFDAERYLGKWYEIASLDHSFERGLTQVSAEYSWRDDGAVRVLNRGFDAEEGEWKEAEGVARFVGEPSDAHLKVSFFGPFYGSYVVFELEKENYSYSFVSGYNESYLWFLSRTPEVPQSLRDEFEKQARALGFDTEELIWVDQSTD